MKVRKEKKRRIFDIIQIGNYEDRASRRFDIMIIAMIVVNLLLAVYETFESSVQYKELLGTIELITVVTFTVEYGLRLWTAEFLYHEKRKARAALRFAFSFNGIVDLLSFLPYYLPFFFPAGAVAFRMFRVIRILRLFRVNAYSDALNVITSVVSSKKDQLLSSIFIIFVLMTASSLCMYSLEHEAQPEVFRNAFSGFWWAVSTLLTVGYGDIYPITAAGRVFGIIITFLGVGMVAIPTGILSAGFVEQYSRMKGFEDCAKETNLQFVRLQVEKGHPWEGKRIAELNLPPDLMPVVVQRGNRSVIPRRDLVIQGQDIVVIEAEKFQNDAGVELKEIQLPKGHPWIGFQVREIVLSRFTKIVMVIRGGISMIPTDGLELQEEDEVVLFKEKS